MIELGFFPFNNLDNLYFKELNRTEKYEIARFEKAIFDEAHIMETVEVDNDGETKSWTTDTVFLWKCDSVEAGNINLEGVPIHNILLKRRKKGEYVFENIHEFDYDAEKQFYQYKDRFIESHEDYVYGIQPIGGAKQSPVLGEVTTGEVSTEFDSVWITGREQQYKLMYNLEVGEYQTNVPHEIVETLGNQFPTVMTNGTINYRQGSLSCMLISDGTMAFENIDTKSEKHLRKSIMAFLTERKPKYFKDGSGEKMLISIVGAPTLKPENKLGRLIYDMSVDFVEIGTTSASDLMSAGLIDEVI